VKKTLLTLFFCLASLQIAGAAVLLEGIGGYTAIADADNMTGFGGGAGIQVTDNLNFIVRGFFGNKINNPNDPDEEKYSHMMVLGFMEYYYRLPSAPVAFSGYLGLGYSETEIEEPAKEKLSDSGACAAFGAGFYFIMTQHISPFLTVGYQKSFYGVDMKDLNIGGFQVLLGVRASIFGRNKSIMEGY